MNAGFTVAMLIVVIGFGLALDGYSAFAAGNGSSTSSTLCGTGLVSTIGGPCLTSTTVIYTTTQGGTVTIATSTINPSNVPITIVASPSGSTISGSPVTFTASVAYSLQNPIWTWNFGDGVSVGGNPVSHSFPSPGIYVVSVSLAAANALGTAQYNENIICPPLLTCTPTLTVNVISSYSGSSIGGASVTVLALSGGSSQTGITNSAGQAIFPVNPSTSYSVGVSATNYLSSSQTVTVGTTGASVVFNLVLSCSGSFCPRSIVGSFSGGSVTPINEILVGLFTLAVGGIFAFVFREDGEE